MTAKTIDQDLLAWEQELRTAQTRNNNAEALKLEREAELAKLEIAQQKIMTDALKRDNDYAMASDEHHHVYKFFGGVSAQSATACMSVLSRWHRLDPDCPVTIIFNSPGGSVINGMALWDFLTTFKAQGHHLTTVCRGMAASMGGILLQAGDVRQMGAESYILIHEISAGTGGKIGEMQDDIKFYKMMCDRVVKLFVARSGGLLTAAVLKKNWERTDWWIASDQALTLGLVDEVI